MINNIKLGEVTSRSINIKNTRNSVSFGRAKNINNHDEFIPSASKDDYKPKRMGLMDCISSAMSNRKAIKDQIKRENAAAVDRAIENYSKNADYCRDVASNAFSSYGNASRTYSKYNTFAKSVSMEFAPDITPVRVEIPISNFPSSFLYFSKTKVPCELTNDTIDLNLPRYAIIGEDKNKDTARHYMDFKKHLAISDVSFLEDKGFRANNALILKSERPDEYFGGCACTLGKNVLFKNVTVKPGVEINASEIHVFEADKDNKVSKVRTYLSPIITPIDNSTKNWKRGDINIQAPCYFETDYSSGKPRITKYAIDIDEDIEPSDKSFTTMAEAYVLPSKKGDSAKVIVQPLESDATSGMSDFTQYAKVTNPLGE